ncbi:GNAT family N-acetyltransferase [Nocardioides sp. LHG3406-4]|uniref:GNAT family N-acetyltransferase n=1 Tax=Nocardioides sp. LHG3406-4 TaxID=2804575 RepID=UPI003CF5B6FB
MPQTAPPVEGRGRDGATSRDELGKTVAAAERDAREAADWAQIEIVEPQHESAARQIEEVGDRVWGPGGTFARNELRAIMHAGDPVHLALDRTLPGLPAVGFAVGFLGWAPVLHVHSHQVGVVDGYRRRGVGYALKLAQRHTCLAQGITDMRWTFDPLVRRNAAFNLEALGARAAAFYVDFYGVMDDAINDGDASDRLEAIWALAKPLPPAPAPAPATDDELLALLVERDGWPQLTGTEPSAGAVLAVPADYETLRRRDPARSKAWRAACREVLRAAYDDGLRVGRVTDARYQLVDGEDA